MIVVSHRGPFEFRATGDGGFAAVRGAGGLISALGPLLLGNGGRHVREKDARWIAAAISDDDRAAAAAGAATAENVDLHLLALDPEAHRLHYEVVSNTVLWFLHHGLLDLVNEPAFGDDFAIAWDAYVAVNEAFAAEVVSCADEGEPVLVQDYQLTLVPELVRAARPDLPVSYFQHTPFAGPLTIAVLPEHVRRRLLASAAAVPSGFHARRWARSYETSVRDVIGGEPRATFVSPLGADPVAMAEVASSDETEAELRDVEALVGDRRMVYRTDRLEPSKNIVRGFLAYDLLLEHRPDLRGAVTFVAFLYRSREHLAEYVDYAAQVDEVVARVNDRWATAGWSPIVLDVRDDYPRSVAGLRRYDVLLVNPIRDGLNLVAKEGPLVNERDGVVCLSPEAGAFEELSEAVVECHPYDLTASAAALAAALDEPAKARAKRAARLRDLASARTPADWLADQLGALGVTEQSQ
jgi:trehalose 6-phosphate synthase